MSFTLEKFSGDSGETLQWYETGSFAYDGNCAWVKDRRYAADQVGAALERLRFLNEDLPLLDGFAKVALAGFLAAHAGDGITLPSKDLAAKWAYGCAEALLAERKRRMEAAQ